MWINCKYLPKLPVELLKMPGGDHIDTRAVRQYLNNLEVTIKMGRYEFGPAKPTDTRSQDRPYSSLSWREKDLKNFERKAKRAYLQSQAGSRPTSKEDYRSISRGSNLTFLSASEKLMMESDRPRLLHRESIDRRLQQTSTPRTVTDVSETTEPKKQVTLEIRVDGLEEENETTEKVPETRVADPQIDSFGEELIPQPGGTFITSAKSVRTSPDTNTEERGPSKLYKRFGSAGSDRSGSVCSKHGDSKLKSNRNLYSARSGSSYITADHQKLLAIFQREFITPLPGTMSQVATAHLIKKSLLKDLRKPKNL
ncbi:hypothetical protein KUTeg_020139 [Tegillarca granosa]|uniref:Uncharacterized protein n=1 Tax=Tegillarca granosa TaxID=220873 RepID=A0ABQ9EC63_TEGGR|nr:hypothetical protein KUTeg_020139 [Tegillarca granosa]